MRDEEGSMPQWIYDERRASDEEGERREKGGKSGGNIRSKSKSYERGIRTEDDTRGMLHE